MPADFNVFLRNITLTGGVAPARAYIEELLPDILDRDRDRPRWRRTAPPELRVSAAGLSELTELAQGAVGPLGDDSAGLLSTWFASTTPTDRRGS